MSHMPSAVQLRSSPTGSANVTAAPFTILSALQQSSPPSTARHFSSTAPSTAASTDSIATDQAASSGDSVLRQCSACGRCKGKSKFFSVQWAKTSLAEQPRCKQCVANKYTPTNSDKSGKPQPTADRPIVTIKKRASSWRPSPSMASSLPVPLPPPTPFVDDEWGLRVCDACISAKPKVDFSSSEWSRPTAPRRCLLCERFDNRCQTRLWRPCNWCMVKKGQHEFSVEQWLRKPRRCNQCLMAMASSHKIADEAERTLHLSGSVGGPSAPRARRGKPSIRRDTIVHASQAEYHGSLWPTEHHSLPTTPRSTHSTLSFTDDGRPTTTDPFSPTDGESEDERKDEAVSSEPWSVDADCTVCRSRQCSAMLLPCYHVSCCFKCALQLKNTAQSCPRCETRIDDFLLIRLYR